MKRKINNGTFAYKKDLGKVRISNEDETRVLVNSSGDILMIVADGMGGTTKGDYASNKLCQIFSEEFLLKKRFLSYIDCKFFIRKILKKVNKDLFNLSDSDNSYKGMGTTVVISILHNNHLIVASVGDSRCYLLKNKKLQQITEDETVATYLYNSGQIKYEEIKNHPKKHILTNAIGIYPSLSVNLKVLNYDKETILLCSDGLFNNVNEPDIENILRTDDNTSKKVDTLINVANYNGGSDNISIALWEFKND